MIDFILFLLYQNHSILLIFSINNTKLKAKLGIKKYLKNIIFSLGKIIFFFIKNKIQNILLQRCDGACL